MTEKMIIKTAASMAISDSRPADPNSAHIHVKIGLMITATNIPDFPAPPQKKATRTFPLYAYDPVSNEHYYIEVFNDGTFAFSHPADMVIREAARLLAIAQ